MIIRAWPSLDKRLRRTLWVALLAGCSAGGDGGGQLAGIEGTGIVSGFGSIYVNGIEFATDDAEVIFNGDPADEAALRVGDVVTVTGVIEADGDAVARRIVFDRYVDGPIERISVNNGQGELTALGQTWVVDANTTFINTPADELREGDLIAASGLVDSSGTMLRATSVQQGGPYEAGVTRIDAEGVVRDLDGDRFRIGGLTVAFGNASIVNTSGALDEGTYVEVFGTQDAADDAPLRADTVEVRSRALGEPGEQVFIEAIITDFNGIDDFRLNGQPVDASEATRTDDSALQPASGVAAAVRGELRDGVVRADTLTVEPPADITLSAPLDAVDADAGTLRLLGVDGRVRADTLYLDTRATNDRRLRIGGLAVGDTIAVSGFVGANGFVVTRVERLEPAPAGSVRALGPLEAVQRSGNTGTLIVAGVSVRTSDARTTFRGRDGAVIDAANFFARVALDARVDARGPGNADEINVATEVRLGE